MQDLSTTARSSIEASPSAGGLPPDLFERIAAADVLILIGSSEEHDKTLTVQTVLAAPTFEPEHIASHAYTLAVHTEHASLLRKVRGEPTDAQRYQALRQFAVLARTDSQRFATINEMLQRFEDQSGVAEDPLERAGADHDRMADFLIHALIETEPQAGAEQPAQA